ncbi:hypothetical protein J3E69DRAFT_373214 [Trichoderma sp. SZMC 28015]
MALENAIYNKAAECLKIFNDCIESMVSTPWPQDQLDRFNLWAAHGGIFGSYEKRTSMDWRLRERPELVDMILQLLALLHEYLSAICILTDPIAGRAIAAAENTSGRTQLPSSHASTSASSSECSFGQAAETSSVAADPIDTMRGKVEQTLSELFRISAAIRSAGMSYRHTKAANFVEWQDGVNLTQKFREGIELLLRYKKPSPIDYMVKRLIETVCLRQRELAYSRRKRVDRSEKEGSVKSHSVASLPPRSTAGYSRQGGSGSTPSRLGHTGIGALRGKTAQHDAVQSIAYTATYVPATVFPQTKPVKTLMARPQWSTIDDSLTDLPLPPEVGERLEFECPYCGIPLARERFQGPAWRNHVLEDIRPYVCILPDCKTPHALYKTSDSWISHMQIKHKVAKWKCVSSCQSNIRTFQTEAEFLTHAEDEHKEDFTTEEMLELANIGRYEINRELGADILSECPICRMSFEDLDFLTMYSHIAKELAEYAWISLPDSPHADTDVSQKASSKSASFDDGRIGQRRESEIEADRMFPWSLWDSDDPETRIDLIQHDADLKLDPDPSDADVAVLAEIRSDIRNARRERLRQEPDPSQNFLREYKDEPNLNEGEDVGALFEDPTRPLKFDLSCSDKATSNPEEVESYGVRKKSGEIHDDRESGPTVTVERLLWVDGYEGVSLENQSKRSDCEMTLVVLKVVLATHDPLLKFGYVKISLGFEDTNYRRNGGLNEPRAVACAPFRSTPRWKSSVSHDKEGKKFDTGIKIGSYGADLPGGSDTGGAIHWDRTDFDAGRSYYLISNKTGHRNGVAWVLEQYNWKNTESGQEFTLAVLISRASSEPYLFRFQMDTWVGTLEEFKNKSADCPRLQSIPSQLFLVTPWKETVCNFEGKDIIKYVDLINMGMLRDQEDSSQLDLKWSPGCKVEIPTPLQPTSGTQDEGETKLPKLKTRELATIERI